MFVRKKNTHTHLHTKKRCLSVFTNMTIVGQLISGHNIDREKLDEHKSHLPYVDLVKVRDCSFVSDDLACELFDFICNARSITRLEINNTNFTLDTFRSIIWSISRASNLEHVLFVDDAIQSDQQMAAIVTHISSFTNFKKLALGNNTGVSAAAICDFVHALHMSPIKNLCLSFTQNLDTKIIECLASSQLEQIWLKSTNMNQSLFEILCAGLVSNTTIQHLDVSLNNLTDATIYWSTT